MGIGGYHTPFMLVGKKRFEVGPKHVMNHTHTHTHTYTHSHSLTSIRTHTLTCCNSRFLINIPKEGQEDPMKLCTHIELAYWFYLDLVRPEDTSLPGCSMKEFMAASILTL